ncbi:MAG: hypothetical protein B7X69_09335 [Sulfurovum sp. 39-42-12]|nr:MAG: hypothetical protein B7Y23_02770 [Sulfurovum sp. 16-42-52]OZA46167.1 MAG: hypothetical protein B7X80_03200 [Sulfurovum sp. 17-42-90]OZA59119.1 MAG: hypothetical protein B7X69_09335 [Sulfurovum sp. 39-42-12]HQR74234.1 hypothetical protein [Sulfurovum sp.]
MGYKTSEEQRNALTLRAKEIGLDDAIAHECRSEEQQDAMLELQKQIGVQTIIYSDMSKRSPQKPTRDYEAAQQKLDDLIEYARGLGDKDAWVLLSQVKIEKASSSRNYYRNYVKDSVEKKLSTIDASKTRIEILIKAMMQYFDSYEPTKMYYDNINGFSDYLEECAEHERDSLEYEHDNLPLKKRDF